MATFDDIRYPHARSIGLILSYQVLGIYDDHPLVGVVDCTQDVGVAMARVMYQLVTGNQLTRPSHSKPHSLRFLYIQDVCPALRND